MNHIALQCLLRKTGHYAGALDGQFGPASRAALILAMTSTNPEPLTQQDYDTAAKNLGVEVKAIKAVVRVESGASGFTDGLPVILPEPHVFSRLTAHRYDGTHPTLSYRAWDKSRYPRSQGERWEQLARMVGLDVDAGFACASYGRFQILGSNHKACGFNDSFEHALAHSHDEESQLVAFQNFVRSSGLDSALRAKDWAKFARGYNGASYKVNKYDQRLAAAYMTA